MIALVSRQDFQAWPLGAPVKPVWSCLFVACLSNENGKGNGAFYKVTAVNHTKIKVLTIIYGVKN